MADPKGCLSDEGRVWDFRDLFQLQSIFIASNFKRRL